MLLPNELTLNVKTLTQPGVAKKLAIDNLPSDTYIWVHHLGRRCVQLTSEHDRDARNRGEMQQPVQLIEGNPIGLFQGRLKWCG